VAIGFLFHALNQPPAIVTGEGNQPMWRGQDKAGSQTMHSRGKTALTVVAAPVSAHKYVHTFPHRRGLHHAAFWRCAATSTTLR
jgi:hypothetical protein